jgi:hypothetical protein
VEWNPFKFTISKGNHPWSGQGYSFDSSTVYYFMKKSSFFIYDVGKRKVFINYSQRSKTYSSHHITDYKQVGPSA